MMSSTVAHCVTHSTFLIFCCTVVSLRDPYFHKENLLLLQFCYFTVKYVDANFTSQCGTFQTVCLIMGVRYIHIRGF